MDLNKNILFENNHLIVINKPSGTLSQGDSSSRTALNHQLKQYIKLRDNKPGNVFIGIIHRLDHPVSGVIIYAKTSKGASRLSEQIRTRVFSKFYICVTERNSTHEALENWQECTHFFIRPKDRTLAVEQKSSDAKSGTLFYTTFMRSESRAFHLVKLKTGRKHQIRASFSYLNMPIIGDSRYDSKIKMNDTILLHSYSISCSHPTTNEDLVFSAPPPDYFFNSEDSSVSFHNSEVKLQQLIRSAPR